MNESAVVEEELVAEIKPEKVVVVEKKTQPKIKAKPVNDKEEKTPKVSNKRSVTNTPAVEVPRSEDVDKTDNFAKPIETPKSDKDNNDQLVSRSGRKIKPKR